MKLTIFKALLASIFICSLVLSRVIKNDKTGNNENGLFKSTEGSGSWDTFYECPRINIAKANGNYEDQGAAKIFAKNILGATVNEDKLGLVFEFKNGPAEAFKKIATLVSGTKYYIPYRYFSSEIAFGNPLLNNKYLEGTLTGDDKVHYKIKIDLPYKSSGHFLNDKEGRKMATAINFRSVTQKSTVKDLKSNISGQTSAYIEKKKQLDAVQKGEEELKKVLNAQEKEATEMKGKMDSRKTEIENQKKVISEDKIKVFDAETKLQKLQDTLNADTAKYNQITGTIAKEKTNKISVEDKVKNFQKDVDDVNTKLGKDFANLRNTAPVRKPEIDNGEAAVKKADVKALAKNLNKIHP